MKRSFICLFFLSFLIASSPSHAIEVVVEMTGAENFVQLKDGIQKTITARCLAAGTPPGDGNALTVSLMQLGEIISFDAVLDSQPPRAFHRDVGSRGELSGVIDQMIEEMLQAGHPPPECRATPHSFTVLLSNKRERPSAPKWTRNMNERQARAVNFVRESGSITNREYRQLCSDVSPETLRLDLVDLVDRGILLKIGSKKGTYYILK